MNDKILHAIECDCDECELKWTKLFTNQIKSGCMLKENEFNKKYVYKDKDYEALEEALEKANLACYGRPDQFQYYQNELSRSIANFLLAPYWNKIRQKEYKKKKDPISELYP